jgi:5-formyltetrahydrofolate cyclo-ligase
MSEIDEKKKQIRKHIRELKLAISLDDKKLRSANLFQKLEQLDIFQKSNVVMLYWSLMDEVFTHDFIEKWQHKKQLILPAIDGSNLQLKKFEGFESLKPGESFGILEPSGTNYDAFEKIELIIVPGIAFDRQNNRMGRGKAYYDKLLKNSMAFKLGVCFDVQLLANVPVDEFDVKMDLVLTC